MTTGWEILDGLQAAAAPGIEEPWIFGLATLLVLSLILVSDKNPSFFRSIWKGKQQSLGVFRLTWQEETTIPFRDTFSVSVCRCDPREPEIPLDIALRQSLRVRMYHASVPRDMARQWAEALLAPPAAGSEAVRIAKGDWNIAVHPLGSKAHFLNDHWIEYSQERSAHFWGALSVGEAARMGRVLLEAAGPSEAASA